MTGVAIDSKNSEPEGRSPWKSAEERAREREEQRALKRDAVLLAAAQVFNERGYHLTTLDTIAEKLNVTKPTVYYYLSNKEAILTECFRTGCGVLINAADDVEQSELTGIDKLAAFMRRYAEAMTTDFVMNVVRLDLYGLDPEIQEEIGELKSGVDLRFRVYIEEGIADGTIADCDPKMTAFAIAGALNWIGRWYQPDGPLGPPEIADMIATRLVEGLRSH